MPIEGFASVQEWSHFNSSLLIEVTRPTGVFTCTGVAVSPETIVTAAHCLDGVINSAKVYEETTMGRSFEVKGYKIHPQYNPSSSRFKSDVAKVHLKYKLPSSINIYPIYHLNDVKGNIYRFGFGERNNKNVRTVITPRLRRVNTSDKVVELDDKYSYSGDSGGPVFLQNGDNTYILAIHSTLSFGPEGKFSYNPLLAPYYSWIFEH